MKKIILKAPFNSLSFGQVSYNLCREFYKKNIDLSIFPIGENLDLSCFDKIDKGLFKWIKKSVDERYSGIDKNTPSVQMWHLRGSDSYPTKNSLLYTFHEVDGVTSTEKSICSLHDHVIFSSSFSSEKFSSEGVSNCSHSPIGFDLDINKNDKKYFSENCINFGLIGKWEKRKNTERIIKNWVSLFGNKKDYKLTCLVQNPFFKPDMMQQLIRNTLDNKNYFNVTFLPRLNTNSEVNDLYNSIDIDLSGLSSGEGWNLPAFNSTCLGKWSCVALNSSHKDWANNENAIIIEPNQKIEVYDNAFFRKGDEYNQGYFNSFTDDLIIEAINKSLNFAKKPNPNGEKLKEKFSYEKTCDSIIEKINDLYF